MALLRQATLPVEGGGLGNTVPSDVVLPADSGSGLDSADAIVALPGMRDAVATVQDCSALLYHQVAVHQVPIHLTPGTGGSTFRTFDEKCNTCYRVNCTSFAGVPSGGPRMRALPTLISVMDLIDRPEG
jgi:hypothetical protein